MVSAALLSRFLFPVCMSDQTSDSDFVQFFWLCQARWETAAFAQIILTQTHKFHTAAVNIHEFYKRFISVPERLGLLLSSVLDCRPGTAVPTWKCWTVAVSKSCLRESIQALTSPRLTSWIGRMTTGDRQTQACTQPGLLVGPAPWQPRNDLCQLEILSSRRRSYSAALLPSWRASELASSILQLQVSESLTLSASLVPVGHCQPTGTGIAEATACRGRSEPQAEPPAAAGVRSESRLQWQSLTHCRHHRASLRHWQWPGMQRDCWTRSRADYQGPRYASGTVTGSQA